MDKKHTHSVQALARQVAEYYKHEVPFRIYHGSTNSTRIQSFKRSEMVDISGLNRVLSVDVENRTAIVEPNVPMDALARETLKYGLIPPVVMEFPGITVGGGIQGGAGESSSFTHGCFNAIFDWYEMLLADGSLHRVSRSENADLFHGTAGAFGTLGIITAAQIQLIPATKYVEVSYTPVTTFQDAVDVTLEKSQQKAYDYIDGIMFGNSHGVIITGKLSDKPTGKTQRFSRAHDQWYYLHAEAIDRAGRAVTETVPLTDYLFRYDRGAFWVGRYAFERFGVRFNRLNRWFFNPVFHTRKLYQALQESGASQQYIVQDLALPQDKAAQFMQFVDQEFAIYPLWLCPLKPDMESPLQSNNLPTPMVINVGVWGSLVEDYDTFIAGNRQIEQKVMALGGKKWFYAHAYYTAAEFWKLYDKNWYTGLRKKYHAESLPGVFEKVSVTVKHPISMRRGIYKTIFGLAKLQIKD